MQTHKRQLPHNNDCCSALVRPFERDRAMKREPAENCYVRVRLTIAIELSALSRSLATQTVVIRIMSSVYLEKYFGDHALHIIP